MTRLAPLFALLASLSSWAQPHPDHFRGALIPVSGSEPDVSLSQLTRDQLRAAYTQTDLARPSLGPPIALTATGGGLVLASIAFLVYGALFELAGTLPPEAFGAPTNGVVTAGYALLAIGAALAVAGGVMLPTGLVRLLGILEERRPYSARLDEINARLDDLDRPPDVRPPPFP